VTSYDEFEFFEVTREDRILVVTLNRPERLNAIGKADHAEIPRLLRAVANDDDTDVLLLRGAGRAFSVGGHYETVFELLDDPKAVLRVQREVREMIQAHIDLEKPVVSAVHGRVSGGAFAFAMLADIIVAERGTLFADGHVAYGMAAGDGGALIWPLSVGLTRAKRYLLTGDWVDAEEAERIGLVTELVDEGHGHARGLEWARRLAGLNPAAVQLSKRALNNWLSLGMHTAFDASLAYEMLTLQQPETAEIIRTGLRPADRKRNGGTP
jgi:enoyl-CoA hydratase